VKANGTVSLETRTSRREVEARATGVGEVAGLRRGYGLHTLCCGCNAESCLFASDPGVFVQANNGLSLLLQAERSSFWWYRREPSSTNQTPRTCPNRRKAAAPSGPKARRIKARNPTNLTYLYKVSVSLIPPFFYHLTLGTYLPPTPDLT
jgi:hypothetical protein